MSTAAISEEAEGPAPGEITVLLDQLRQVAGQIAQVASETVDLGDLAVACAESGAAGASVDAALTSVMEAADRKAIAPRSGSRHLDKYVLARSNESGFDVRARLRRARWLRDFPVFADAHAAGTLTVEHVERIRKGLDNPRTHFLLRRDQESLVEAAATCDFVDFGHACDYWKLAADPDGAEPREQIAKTSFNARRLPDGMVKLDGLLDPLAGQVVLTAWEKAKQHLAMNDTDAEINRTEGQRGAVALLQLVAKGAARADGAQPDPLIHLVMSQAVAEDTLRRLTEPDLSQLPLDFGDVDQRCELIDGTPIHPHMVLAIFGIAALRRTVMDAKGRPIETSYATRAFPKHLRYLLLLRSRGRCETDGCDAPFSWLQVDHNRPWSKGGATAYDNANMFCRPDNLAKGDG